MPGALAPAAAGFGLGLALAGAPGPVQAVIITEAVRGGVPRGVRAQAGANLTFAVLLVALALGVSLIAPTGIALRALKVAGGVFLLWLAADGLLSTRWAQDEAGAPEPGLPPVARGTLAVLLNPGAWLFLATAASSLLSAATHSGGTPVALLAAIALALGVAAGDGLVVVLGGVGIRRAGRRVERLIRRTLALVLGLLGAGLLVSGVIA